MHELSARGVLGEVRAGDGGLRAFGAGAALRREQARDEFEHPPAFRGGLGDVGTRGLGEQRVGEAATQGLPRRDEAGVRRADVRGLLAALECRDLSCDQLGALEQSLVVGKPPCELGKLPRARHGSRSELIEVRLRDEVLGS